MKSVLGGNRKQQHRGIITKSSRIQSSNWARQKEERTVARIRAESTRYI